MNSNYKWGILGCGKIARKFAEDLKRCQGAELYAVASRDMERSEAFAQEMGFEKAYGNYHDFVQDSELDIVYIATPHPFHKAHSMLAMQEGKHVLCEKAFAMNRFEAEEMINLARKKKVFLMEAFWTRFKPKFEAVLNLTESKTYGDLKFLRSDFLFNGPYDPNNRLYNIELGGGSLLDIGIYPVFMALSLLGKPDDISCLAQFSPTGSEESISITFKYNSGALASLNSSFEAWSKNDTELCFEEAAVRFSRDEAEDLLLFQNKENKRIEVDHFQGHGYQFEAKHVMECLENKLLESPKLPLDFSLMLMETLDEIRLIAGIKYPQDQPKN